jgi:hypothetical protein
VLPGHVVLPMICPFTVFKPLKPPVITPEIQVVHLEFEIPFHPLARMERF